MLKLLTLICFTLKWPVSCTDITQIAVTTYTTMPPDLSKSAVVNSIDDLKLQYMIKIELLEKNEMAKLIELGPTYVTESLIILTNAFSKVVIDIRNQISNIIATYPIDYTNPIPNKRTYDTDFLRGVKDKVRALDICKYKSRLGISPVELIPMFRLYKKAPQFNDEILKKFESYLYSGGYYFTRSADMYNRGYDINTGLCY